MKTNITKCLSNNFQVTYQSDFWSVFNFNNAEIEVFENNNSNQIDIFKYKKYCDIVGTNSDIKYFESDDKAQKTSFPNSSRINIQWYKPLVLRLITYY